MDLNILPGESSRRSEFDMFSLDFPQDELTPLVLDLASISKDAQIFQNAADNLKASPEHTSIKRIAKNELKENRSKRQMTTEDVGKSLEILKENGLLSGIVLNGWEYSGCGYKEVYVERPLSCLFCDKKFPHNGPFFAHVGKNHRESNESESVRCAECQAGFGNERRLSQHISAVHDKSCIMEVCDICGAPFSAKGACSTHRRIAHQIEPEHKKKKNKLVNQKISKLGDVVKDGLIVFTCDECGYITETQRSIETHVHITHSQYT